MRLAAKLAFVHRTLWRRDRVYRWAALLGPPPLLGGAASVLALAAWQAVAVTPAAGGADVPWAQWTRPVADRGGVVTEAPDLALPPADAAGGLAGFTSGWLGAVQPVTMDAAMDPDLHPTELRSFTVNGPGLPLGSILASAGQAGLIAGTARTRVVIRTAGVYGFSVRLARSSMAPADCLVRLGTRHARLISNLTLGDGGDEIRTPPAVDVRLEPGLAWFGVAVGCWSGGQVAPTGDVTLMIRHPGATALVPARADEVVRPQL